MPRAAERDQSATAAATALPRRTGVRRLLGVAAPGFGLESELRNDRLTHLEDFRREPVQRRPREPTDASRLEAGKHRDDPPEAVGDATGNVQPIHHRLQE